MGQLSVDHIRLGIALFVGYSLLSCLRKPLSTSFPLIKEEFLLSSSQYGVLLSNYSLFFGMAKFLGGVLSDTMPPKILFLSSILLGSCACLGVSFCTSFDLIAFCWIANGLAQGLCWPACAKLITTCFPPNVMGTLWSILSCATSAGAIVTPTLLLLAMPHGWRWVFQCISFVGFLGALLGFLLIRDEDKLALDVAEAKAASSPSKKSTQNRNRSKNQSALAKTPEDDSLLETLLFNYEVQLVFIAGMFAYFALCMLTDWLSLYLAEYNLQTLTQTTELLVWLEIGTLIGAFVSGILSDILCGQRAVTAMLFATLSIPVLFYFPSTQLREIAQYEVLKLAHSAPGAGTLAPTLMLTPFWGVGSSIVMDVDDIYKIARICIFISGFAMNGPKTLLVGGLLGLVGQCGAFTGSMLLSHLLTGKSSRTYSLAELIPDNFRQTLMEVISKPGTLNDVAIGNGRNWIEYILQGALSTLLGEYTAWELFPKLYILCGFITVLMLIIPAICEFQRLLLSAESRPEVTLSKEKKE